MATVYAGNSLTKEAEATAAIVSKFMHEFTQNECEKLDFIYSINHLKSRNLNVENFLFVIDWKILLVVSENSLMKFCLFLKFSSRWHQQSWHTCSSLVSLILLFKFWMNSSSAALRNRKKFRVALSNLLMCMIICESAKLIRAIEFQEHTICLWWLHLLLWMFLSFRCQFTIITFIHFMIKFS